MKESSLVWPMEKGKSKCVTSEAGAGHCNLYLPSWIIPSGRSQWGDTRTLTCPEEAHAGRNWRLPPRASTTLPAKRVNHLKSSSNSSQVFRWLQPQVLGDILWVTLTQNHSVKLFLKARRTETVKYRNKLLLLSAAWGICYTTLANYHKPYGLGQVHVCKMIITALPL